MVLVRAVGELWLDFVVLASSLTVLALALVSIAKSGWRLGAALTALVACAIEGVTGLMVAPGAVLELATRKATSPESAMEGDLVASGAGLVWALAALWLLLNANLRRAPAGGDVSAQP